MVKKCDCAICVFFEIFRQSNFRHWFCNLTSFKMTRFFNSNRHFDNTLHKDFCCFHEFSKCVLRTLWSTLQGFLLLWKLKYDALISRKMFEFCKVCWIGLDFIFAMNSLEVTDEIIFTFFRERKRTLYS